MIRFLIFISLLLMIHASLAQIQAIRGPEPQPAAKKWPTLSGEAPLVVARGGLSGLFPESSNFANQMALNLKYKTTEVALFCNLQLTKDEAGICVSDIRLDNETTIELAFPNASKTYMVNGQPVKGWFAADYPSQAIIEHVTLVQSSMSRTNAFDGQLPVTFLDDMPGLKPKFVWLNVQYDAFYTERKLSMTSYLEKALRLIGINFISSPEIGFLKSMNGKVNKARTKLIFHALDADKIEPTTKQTYGEILKDLAGIKTFASGILVPKGYIWPVNPNNYLGNPTTLAADAHKLGLEVYASGFGNDVIASYNYSFDPTSEYLQFMTDPQTCVDGFLTDFSATASATIACFANNGAPTPPKKGKALIVTHNGASGVYPGCTDLAYEKAVTDGADVIDCSVQMSKDGVAFCLDSADLTGKTTVMPTFMSRIASIPEVQKEKGVFSFDLTWSEIQTLKPQMQSPLSENAAYQRNPIAKNMGKFVTLVDFLELAKAKAVSGIMINIQNAAYLASKRGIDIVDSVTKALSNATFDKQQTQLVFIQSSDSSVLSKFKGVPTYGRLLLVPGEKGDAPKRTVDEIKKYADGVVVQRPTLLSVENGFTKAQTKVVEEMHAANLTVFVSVLRNEFFTFPFDFFADPTVELATYVAAIEVDGVVTEFPGTASKYMRSPCVDVNGDMAILPAEAGELLRSITPGAMPPSPPPNPPIEVADVVDPPLPPVANASSTTTPPPGSKAPISSGMAITANHGLCIAAIMALSLLSVGFY